MTHLPSMLPRTALPNRVLEMFRLLVINRHSRSKTVVGEPTATDADIWLRGTSLNSICTLLTELTVMLIPFILLRVRGRLELQFTRAGRLKVIDSLAALVLSNRWQWVPDLVVALKFVHRCTA